MSFFSLKVPVSLRRNRGKATKPVLSKARAFLHGAEVQGWFVENLSLKARAGGQDVLAAVVDYCLAKRSFFAAADVVIIEQQPKAAMRAVAAGLYAAAKLLAREDAAIKLQSPVLKLAWGDLETFCDSGLSSECLSSYAGRKKASVLVAAKLVEDVASLAGILAAHKKKDDLSDAMLQALAYVCRTYYGLDDDGGVGVTEMLKR